VKINELEEQEALHSSAVAALEQDIAELEKRLKGTDASKLTENLAQIADEVRRLQARISKCDATIADFRLQEDYNEKKLADAKEHLETTDEGSRSSGPVSVSIPRLLRIGTGARRRLWPRARTYARAFRTA